MAKKLIYNTFKESYSIDSIKSTMTVGELINTLKEYDMDTPVYLSFNGGRICKYGGFRKEDFVKADAKKIMYAYLEECPNNPNNYQWSESCEAENSVDFLNQGLDLQDYMEEILYNSGDRNTDIVNYDRWGTIWNVPANAMFFVRNEKPFEMYWIEEN